MQTGLELPFSLLFVTRISPGKLPWPLRRLCWTAEIVSLFLIVPLIGCSKNEAKPIAQPPEVQVADVLEQDVPVYGEWVAQLNGPVNADITPKVQGYLLHQLCERIVRKEGTTAF